MAQSAHTIIVRTPPDNIPPTFSPYTHATFNAHMLPQLQCTHTHHTYTPHTYTVHVQPHTHTHPIHVHTHTHPKHTLVSQTFKATANVVHWYCAQPAVLTDPCICMLEPPMHWVHHSQECITLIQSLEIQLKPTTHPMRNT